MGMETIHALNEALFVRDQYTAGHTERVEEYAVMIAKKTLNYSQEALSRLKKKQLDYMTLVRLVFQMAS